MNLQPTLEDDVVLIKPLADDDFDRLYSVASDPGLWSQHPNKNRYRRDVFETFFQGAMQSGGAFIIIHKESGEVMGGTRFYDWDPAQKTILIGYTFFAQKYWGKGMNRRVKNLMMEYAFQFAERVIFHIGASNKRSLRSIERIGAKKTGEQQVQYFGEEPKLNCVYEISKSDFMANSSSS